MEQGVKRKIERGKYVNVLSLDTPKDATLISIMGGFGPVNYSLDQYPYMLISQRRFGYLRAIINRLKYDKMGIFNLVLPAKCINVFIEKFKNRQ